MVCAMCWVGPADVRRFAELDSTNRYVRDQARGGAPEGLVVVADFQSAGRGRLGRRWEAPPGTALLVSVLLRPLLAPDELHLCTAAVALAAAEACAQVALVTPEVKWPNDLVVAEAKLAGVLAESDPSPGSGRASVVVGLGLNLAWPGPPGAGGTSLSAVAGVPVDREALLQAYLSALTRRRPDLDTRTGRRALAAELRDRCATLGRLVRVELAGETLVGTAVDLTEAGHLVVDTEAGSRVVAAGDVIHLRPAPVPEGPPPPEDLRAAH
jgi:BirA family biotin operon repressor/biotin-[acetyl-CoA-carboxylase] ligase